MHVVLIGARPEAVESLLGGGHEVTLLYEGWEERRVEGLGPRVARACPVESPDNLDSVWSALHHSGALPGRVDAVVAVAEFGVLSGALLGRHLGARGLDPDVALRCRDKAVQKAAWQAAGVPTARWAVVPDARLGPDPVPAAVAAAGLTGPYVLKPPAGAGGISVALAADEAELAELARAHPSRRLVVEERCPGPEWHLDGVVRAGTVTDLVVSPYLTPLIETKVGRPQASYALQPAAHPDLYAEAGDLTARALAALGLADGVFHFEVFGEPGRFVAGELAARPGGSRISSVVRRTAGVDLWAACTHLATGEEVPRTAPCADRTFGYVHLPSTPGRVNRVGAEELARLPGVLEVQLAVGVGMPMPDMSLSTSTGVAVVVVEGADEEECRARMAGAVEFAAARNAA